MKSTIYTKSFFLLFSFSFISALSFTCSPIYPLYITHLGGNASTIGWFMGMAPLMAVLSRPFIGSLIDYWGAKRVLLLGSFLLALAPFIYGLILNQGLVITIWYIRIAQGVGWGAFYSSYFTLAGKLSPKSRRNESISIYGIASLSAALVGPLCGEWIVEFYGFKVFFAVMMLLNILAFLVLSFIREPVPIHIDDKGNREKIFLSKTPGLMLILFIAFLFALSNSTPRNFMAPFAHSREIYPFSFYFMVFALSGIIMRLVGGRWADRLGQRKILVPAFLMYGAGLVCLQFSASLYGLIVTGLICGVAHGLAFPAMMVLSYNSAPRHTGKVMALVTGMMDAGSSFNAFMLGVIALHFGFNSILILPITAVILVAIIVLFIPQRRLVREFDS